jgi:hypothetical protein
MEYLGDYPLLSTLSFCISITESISSFNNDFQAQFCCKVQRSSDMQMTKNNGVLTILKSYESDV